MDLRASLYAWEAFINSSASHDRVEILLLIAAGSCFIIGGLWLDFGFMYKVGCQIGGWENQRGYGELPTCHK